MFSSEQSRLWLPADRVHGLVFDGATILGNFYILGSTITTPIEELSDQRIGILLAVGVTAQFLGALLKKGPLQLRIAENQSGESETRENLLGCLSFIHFIFFLIAAAMSLALLGFTDLDKSGGIREFLWVSISAIVAALISGTVWLAIHYSSSSRAPTIWWRYQEVPADVLLWISAVLLTRFFWDALLFESEAPSYIGFEQRAFVLVAAVSLLFMVFYVPARLLFLAEDYKYPTTWLRLWLVAMLPLITIVFIK